jgi:cellulose biosynthesis protein BcsQ
MRRYLAAFRVKGGSGTTTLTANLAGGCAKRRLRVLAVDLDPAGALTWHLAATVPPQGVADVLAGRTPLAGAVARTEVHGLDLLAGSERLTEWDHRPQVARAALAALIEQAHELPHDLVIFDTAPTRGALLAGLLDVLPATDSALLLPVRCRALDLAGFAQAFALLHDGGPPLLGIVPTIRRDALSRDVLLALHEAHRGRVLPDVREAVAVARAPLKHLPVQYAAPARHRKELQP